MTPMTDNAAIAAGRLLAFALDIASDSATEARIVRNVAEQVVTNGIAAGRAYSEGIWYVTGNRRDEHFPFGYNATWRAVTSILDEAERGVGLRGDGTYVIQATRNGRQVPTFSLDANTLGIVSVGHAARIALDVLVGQTNDVTLRFLQEDLEGNLTATVVGTDIIGQSTRQDGVSVQYAIYAAKAG